MRVTAVIGAGYGDEGKGRVVDYLSNNNSIVIRHNGGAQAGHTVVLPSDQRHVFKHIGSGTFQGAKTYLSKYFIVNPIMFRQELELFRKRFNSNPKIYVSPHAFVSTPWDMMINIINETQKGEKRHGSCGCGIHETIFRCHGSFLTNVQLMKTDHAHHLSEMIWNKYAPDRVQDLGLEPSERYQKWLSSENIFNNYIKDLEFFFENVTVEDPDLKDYQHVIFEGAQGLELDKDNLEFFPHVTPSNTGVKNVWKLIHDFELVYDIPEIIYVTRTYKTRHGNGPFPEEDTSMSLEDPTNVPNPYQGNLRFGMIDVNRLVLSISRDMDIFKGEFNPSIALTCSDQYPPHVKIDGKDEFFSTKEFLIHVLCDRLQFSKCYSSHGPRTDSEINIWSIISKEGHVYEKG